LLQYIRYGQYGPVSCVIRIRGLAIGFSLPARQDARRRA
jgi:hypothetical protein